MAKVSTIGLSITVTGDGVTEGYSPPSFPITNNAAPGGVPTTLALAAGDNTIAVPSGAATMLLIPPSASVLTKKLKGVGGDTGFTLSPSAPSMVSLPPGATTMLLNCLTPGESVTIAWL